MGMSADHWKVQHEGHKIEIEAYLAGFMTGGCSLFIDDIRVDSVPHFKSSFSAFTLRHCLKNEGQDTIISVQIKQQLIRTTAELTVGGKSVQMKKIS